MKVLFEDDRQKISMNTSFETFILNKTTGVEIRITIEKYATYTTFGNSRTLPTLLNGQSAFKFLKG